MSLVALLASIAFVMPVAGDGHAVSVPVVRDQAPLVDLPPGEGGAGPVGERRHELSGHELSESFRVPAQDQVRIEQRMTIRIAPRPAPIQPTMLDLPQREIGPRFVERGMGKCVPIAGIAGVQAEGNRLLLFMRDRRIVSAALERACRPRDFYSGFYLQRSGDGQLCVDRDTLLSRSGVNCKLTRLRQLVEADD